MSEAIRYEEYNPETDYEAVTALWRRSGLTIYPIDDRDGLARTKAANPGLFLVAKAGEQLVGAVLGTTDSRALWVQHLAVDAEWRQHGIGGRLLDLLEEQGKARQLGVMLLLVLEDNSTAIRFYERRQWLPVPNVLFMAHPLRDVQPEPGDSPD